MPRPPRSHRIRSLAAIAALATAAACSPTHTGAPSADGGGDQPGADGGGCGGSGCAGPHPFGTHGAYVTDGVIFPGGGASALDDATSSSYDQWKARYLEPACVPGQVRVKTTPATGPYTVSEGHGYGMVITAVMAGYDPDAQRIFDGLYGYYDGHPSSGDDGLMAWAQDADCNDVQGSDSATDGDLDIAYALLMADRQWGSDGDVDYRAEAQRIIASILASEVHASGSVLIGDWAGGGDSHETGTRLSDLMPDHFKAFARASGEARWTDVADKSYAIIDYLQQNDAPATGLVPDFATGATGQAPSPAPANWLEADTDGAYSWNACRVPWRIASDYLVTGDPRAREAVRRLEAWARDTTGDDPASVRDGYQLDGTAIGTAPEIAFVAPLAVGAMIEPESGSNQAWLDALWSFVVDTDAGDYYGDSIKLLSMIVLSGNWWTP